MRRRNIFAAGLLALGAFWALAGAAMAATSSVHIEWRRGTTVYGAQSLTSSGTSAASSAAPNFDPSGQAGGIARITPTQGAAIVIVGPAVPTATQTNGAYVAAGGGAIELPVAPGQEVAIISASDQPVTDAQSAQSGIVGVVGATDVNGHQASLLMDIRDSLVTTSLGTPGVQLTSSSGTKAAAAGTCTLTATATTTAYITGFQVTGGGATAASVIAVTVTGVIGGTMTYEMPIPAGPTVAATPLLVSFPNPVQASALNTNIVVNVPSFGAGSTNASCVAEGSLF